MTGALATGSLAVGTPATGAATGIAQHEYLAKDYASFRAMMLEHLDTWLSGAAPSDPASLEVALVEALAYVADYLSYHQDAVATEAYLSTARQRLSVTRHARLVGYRAIEGCCARTFVAFATAADGVIVPAGAQLVTRVDGAGNVSVSPRDMTDKRVVFETLHPIVLHKAHHRVALADAPRGGDAAIRCAGMVPALAADQVMILCDGRGFAHPLRLTSVEQQGGRTVLRWHVDDALPADLPRGGDWHLLGNVALAQHGRRALLPIPTFSEAGEAVLSGLVLGFAVDPDRACRSAAVALRQDPGAAEPLLRMRAATTGALAAAAPRAAERQPIWQGRRSRLEAAEHGRVVAVETLGADSVMLSLGRAPGPRPAPDFDYVAEVRVGRGAVGNVGPGTLVHLVDAPIGVTSVDNPMAAVGGVDAETLAAVRMRAPASIARPRRAVTDADVVAIALGDPTLRAATVRRRRLPTREEVRVTVADRDDRPLDDTRLRAIERTLRQYALIGQEVRVAAARYVAPDLLLVVQSDGSRSVGALRAAVLAALRDLRFGFGEPVYAEAYGNAVAGVAGVRGAAAVDPAEPGRIAMVVVPPADAIVRVDPRYARVEIVDEAPA